MVAQHGELYKICGIEHGVRRLLERIDPFFLGGTHFRPLPYAFGSREGPLVVVAHYPSQKTVVACRYPVVVVQRRARKSVDENLVFALVRDVSGQLRIEGMDAFYEQDGTLAQLDFLAVVVPCSGDEIVLRHTHLLSGKNLHQVMLHEGMVHRVEIVEVVAAVWQKRGLDPVHEIIVG